MYKKLRRKFIMVSMISVFAALAVIIGLINIINYRSTIASANTLLDVIEANNGVFPEPDDVDNIDPNELDEQAPDDIPSGDDVKPDGEAPDDVTPNGANSDNSVTPPDKPDDDGITPDKDDDIDMSIISDKKNIMDGISSEAAYNTRYFTVTLSVSDGEATAVATDTTKIAAVSEDTAVQYALELYNEDKAEGYLSCYRYRLSKLSSDEVMYIFLDCEHELDTFYDFLKSSAVIGLGGTLLIFILLLIFSRTAISPITESHEKQKRFITDASHEIKTPLAIIDANTEVIEMETGQTQWTESTRKQIGRLNSLTEKMILLSKMDEDEPRISPEKFNISEVLSDVSESFEPVCISKEKILTTDIEPEIYFNGDIDAIRQAFTLLLDNAVKYSDEHGTIHITCSKKGHNINIAFENSVESITPGKHNELFERFYRTDPSRNKETGGFGIGLSTVKAVIENHKGRVSAKSNDEHSISFNIIL